MRVPAMEFCVCTEDFSGDLSFLGVCIARGSTAAMVCVADVTSRVDGPLGPFSHALDHVNEGGPSSGEEEEGVLR